MEQYIPKSALLAEINKRITDAPINNIGHQRVWAYNDVKDIIDTLGIKEVNLDEEVKRFTMSKELYETKSVIRTVAKHFFELGLSANDPITATDRGTAEEIIINLKRVEKDYRIDLTKEIKWLRDKVKKG